MAGHGSCPVLVGRARQMAVLQEAFAAVRQGGHPAVLISGEAGAGKSRLLGEFAAVTAGARVLTGGCLQLGADGLPFAPFTAMLRQLVCELGADTVTAMVPGRGAGELARLTRRQTGELAACLQGHQPSEDLAVRLFERSEGNPLFTEELLHCPDLTRDLPESLRDHRA